MHDIDLFSILYLDMKISLDQWRASIGLFRAVRFKDVGYFCIKLEHIIMLVLLVILFAKRFLKNLYQFAFLLKLKLYY